MFFAPFMKRVQFAHWEDEEFMMEEWRDHTNVFEIFLRDAFNPLFTDDDDDDESEEVRRCKKFNLFSL